MSEAPTLNMADFDPQELAIEDIDVSQRSIWIEDKKMAFFDRLRDEAPVHYCKDSEFGPYWSSLVSVYFVIPIISFTR